MEQHPPAHLLDINEAMKREVLASPSPVSSSNEKLDDDTELTMSELDASAFTVGFATGVKGDWLRAAERQRDVALDALRKRISQLIEEAHKVGIEMGKGFAIAAASHPYGTCLCPTVRPNLNV